MGPGFLEKIDRTRLKRRAYEFWYHPYTELAIFGLIMLSILFLFAEVAIPTGEPIGVLGGLAAGGVVGIFFWADMVITLFFVVEYVSKLWITPKGRKWYFVRHSWIELLAILPVLRVFRLFRIFRAIRVIRLLRVMRSIRLLRTGDVLRRVLEGFGTELKDNQIGNLVIAAYFVSTMAFGTTGVLIFERGTGSDIQTLSDGLWWSIVTLSTVGYGDMVPETSGGRAIAGVVMVMGLGFWSLVTGVFTSTLVERARRKKEVGIQVLGLENHVVVLGWNDNGTRLLRDFRSRHPLQHLVVATDRDNLDIRLHSRHHHVARTPESNRAMTKTQLDTAGTIVILAEHREGESTADVEARTLLLCLKARTRAPQARIVAEILEEDDVPRARSAGADDVVVTDNFAGALISQSVRSPGLHRVYEDLFDVGRGSMFADCEVPDDCVGMAFPEAAAELFTRRGTSLVGLMRDHELQVAPDDETTLRPDDRLLVIQPVNQPKGRR